MGPADRNLTSKRAAQHIRDKTGSGTKIGQIALALLPTQHSLHITYRNPLRCLGWWGHSVALTPHRASANSQQHASHFSAHRGSPAPPMNTHRQSVKCTPRQPSHKKHQRTPRQPSSAFFVKESRVGFSQMRCTSLLLSSAPSKCAPCTKQRQWGRRQKVVTKRVHGRQWVLSKRSALPCAVLVARSTAGAAGQPGLRPRLQLAFRLAQRPSYWPKVAEERMAFSNWAPCKAGTAGKCSCWPGPSPLSWTKPSKHNIEQG